MRFVVGHMRIVIETVVTASRYIKLFYILVIGTIHAVHNYQEFEGANS